MAVNTNNARWSWSARLLAGLLLLIAGAAAMAWALAHYPPMARVLGVERQANRPRALIVAAPTMSPRNAPPVASDSKIAKVEQRIAKVEDMSEQTAGSAGRADALVIAFAARRAIDRGVALGYLENLLVERFGRGHRAAVATVITAARKPLRLSDLVAEYEALGPTLRRGGPKEGWGSSIKRELGSLIEVHSTTRPPADPDARYRRAMQHLSMGNADMALAETMRMPGAAGVQGWIARARRYVAAQRALDEIESAALLGGG